MDYKCSCGTTTTLSEQEVLSRNFKCPNCGKTRQRQRKPHPKPIIAGLLTVIAPGTGHLYAGSIKFGVAILATAVVLANIEWAMIVFWEASPVNIVLPLIMSLAFLVFSVVSAAKTARAYHAVADKPRRVTKFIIYAAVVLVTWSIAYFAMPIFGRYETFVTSSSSMESTTLIGDRILADMSAYDNTDPQRGDLVVFTYPKDHDVTYIKRCVAVGSDVVELRNKELYVNGESVPLPPTGLHNDPEIKAQRDVFGPFTVPANSYFMLGDNREDSYDSRFWGPVPRELIRGRAIRVWFNFKLGRIGLPLK